MTPEQELAALRAQLDGQAEQIGRLQAAEIGRLRAENDLLRSGAATANATATAAARPGNAGGAFDIDQIKHGMTADDQRAASAAILAALQGGN